MTAYRAAWACPIDQPPIRDAVVEISDGVIVAIGAATAAADGITDLGNVVLLPGLINAHTHLELSWLRGRVPPATSFTSWVKGLFATRGAPDSAMTPEMIAPIHDAIREAQASGTMAVGDISNSLAAVEPMAAAGLKGVVFHELLGFKERDGASIEATRARRTAAAAHGIPISLAPHAPYSTSVELFKAIRDAVNEHQLGIMSVHLGESPEEIELLHKGTGPWRAILELIGAWRNDWPTPACGPVEFLDRHGVIDDKTLVVHGVQFDDAALALLRQRGATLVTCPRSNQWVGVGYPPIDRFYQSGVAVAVGTDSLASVENLNLFSELKTMRWLAPGVAARRILESATLVGARALGLEREFGSLTAGKSAPVLAVGVPPGTVDVEEYLLSGIEAPQVQWLA
jgi:cytosine/adenosine deaminase-related metal-dependent hydrolase